MKLGTRFQIVALLVVVVHAVYLRYRLFQGLKVLVKHRVGTRSLGIDKVLYIIVRVISPSSYNNIYALDAGGWSLQVSDVHLIVGLRFCEDIFAVLTDYFSVCFQRAIRINVNIKKQYIRKSRLAQGCNGFGTFSADMSAHIHARYRFYFRLSLHRHLPEGKN